MIADSVFPQEISIPPLSGALDRAALSFRLRVELGDQIAPRLMSMAFTPAMEVLRRRLGDRSEAQFRRDCSAIKKGARGRPENYPGFDRLLDFMAALDAGVLPMRPERQTNVALAFGARRAAA